MLQDDVVFLDMMQGQAGRWLRALHASQGLVVLDPQMPDLVRQLESAIQYGRPVIIQVPALVPDVAPAHRH